MPDFSISALDISILIIYVLGTRIIFGLYVIKKYKKSSSENYFLAGRNLTWPIIGLSFYVSNMSGSTFIGLPGSGYNDGIAVYNYEWIPAVILILFVIFILPSYLKAKVYTAPGFLEKRFDSRSKLAFSGFLLFANIFIDAASALYAGGMVLKVLFPEIPLWQTSFLIAFIAGIYIYYGGLDAVVLNDVVQAIMIFIGGLVIAILTYDKIPSWESVVNNSSPNALSLIRSPSDEIMPWPGIISGVLIVGLYFWCTNQFVIQRALGAKSLDHGRWGSLFAGFLKLPNLFILVLPGVMAVSLYPDLERPDMVFPALAFDLLPVGLRGLMLAALAAAIISSLESIYNSASTLFTMDFIKHFKPELEDLTLVKIGKTSTLAFMILSALWAPQIQYFPTLWQYLQSILSYVTPPVVAVFVIGIFWEKATGSAAFYTLVFGVTIGIVGWIANEILGLSEIQYLYASGIMFVLSVCIMVFFSHVKVEGVSGKELVWHKKYWIDETSTLKNGSLFSNYRVLALLLLFITSVIVVWWN